MVGGAIDPKRVVMKNVDPSPAAQQFVAPGNRSQTFHNLLRDQATLQYGDVSLAPIADAMNDFRPRNQIAYFQYNSHFQKHPESELIKKVETLYSGHGGKRDHPKLHQLFLDSFQHHPELVSLYGSS